ncbi:zinc-dependent alcohol dehydrogenase [Microbacterium sp.]|uniref:zinc-dependent alcohol dehydrogenase n=1 Tax=Microbacterium sp. TaxID=51671 RepID=UPI002BACFCD1|nr:alcohol dehydrogenase catalytic domain-containing protein [Microbacterium sp.]HWK77745.1 alcohol dehydrogenase catalytic domain-containing protein [Microbacterium sp.]
MKAVAKLRPESGALELIEIPAPKPAAGEVLIHVGEAGICGTDISLWKWREEVVAQYAPKFPLVLGHEFSGTVMTAGALVSEGAVVGINPQVACRRCVYCYAGRPTLCRDRTLIGARVNGGWAEFVSVPEENLFELPPGVDLSVLPVLEPLAVATHAVQERARPVPGETVLIFGAGPIGLLTLVLALDAGVGAVYVADPDASRLKSAAALGGIPIDVTSVDPVQVVRDNTFDGVDLVFETSGNHTVPAQAVASARGGARIALIGLAHSPADLLTTPIVLKELELIGSRGYNESSWIQMMRVLPRIQTEVAGIITHRFPLEEFETALRLVAEGSDVGKVALIPA